MKFIPGCAHPGNEWVCLWKVKELFEAKIHPHNYLVLNIKFCSFYKKYFCLLCRKNRQAQTTRSEEADEPKI
jgi:hypothetical protein